MWAKGDTPLAGVGILTIGFASVAQAAGVDRKAYRAVPKVV